MECLSWNLGQFYGQRVLDICSTLACPPASSPLRPRTSPRRALRILPDFQRRRVNTNTTVQKVRTGAALGDPNTGLSDHIEVRHRLRGLDLNAIICMAAVHRAYEALCMLTIRRYQQEVIEETEKQAIATKRET